VLRLQSISIPLLSITSRTGPTSQPLAVKEISGFASACSRLPAPARDNRNSHFTRYIWRSFRRPHRLHCVRSRISNSGRHDHYQGPPKWSHTPLRSCAWHVMWMRDRQPQWTTRSTRINH